MSDNQYSRVELLGYIAEQVLEYALSLNDDTLVPDYNAEIPHDPDWMADLKSDWENGFHCGDCIKVACSCAACTYADMLSTGNSLALALKRNPEDPKGIAKALCNDEESDEKWVHDWALIFMREVKKHGLEHPKQTV